MASPLSLARLAIFIGTIIFSIVVLGLCAHILNETTSFLGFYFYFSSLGVATAVISLVALTTMFVLFHYIDRLRGTDHTLLRLIVDFTRKGALTSAIWFELAVIFVLWILWLATAAEAAHTNGLIGFSSCSSLFG